MNKAADPGSLWCMCLTGAPAVRGSLCELISELKTKQLQTLDLLWCVYQLLVF